MALEFDPNDPSKQKKQPVWATYIPDRRGPAFKQHSDRGKALNAFQYRTQGILYHWKLNVSHGGQWVEVARVEGRSDNCEKCGVKLRTYWNDEGEYRESVWVGKPKLRKIDVCQECNAAILYPLKKEINLEDVDKWYAKYNRSKGVRKVDEREL